MSKNIRKFRKQHYIAAIIITLLQPLLLIIAPDLRQNIVLKTFTSGTVGTAFFIIVMFTGALNNKYKVTKKLLGIRMELSIIASFMVLFHVAYYFLDFSVIGKVLYFSGLIAFIIMLPLFITSFIKIRKKMNNKMWKRLQKWAYLFYALIYVHMCFANIGKFTIDIDKISLYTVIFTLYTYLKVRKSIKSKMTTSARNISIKNIA